MHLDVLNLDPRECVEISGEERVEGFPVEVVRDGNLDDGEGVEDVEFGNVERSVAVNEVRVLEDDEVEPSAATTTTCRDPPLGANFLEVNSDVLSPRDELNASHLEGRNGTHVELFGGERTGSNPRRVGLDDTNDVSNSLGWQSKSRADSSDTSGRTGHVGVGTKVEIEHEGIGSFDEDALLLRHCSVEERRSVDDVGSETASEFLVANDFSLRVISAHKRR